MHSKGYDLQVSNGTMREQFKPLVGIDNSRKKNEEYHILDHNDLDRYKTNSPFKYNYITINGGKYINASPISIGQQQNLFIATQGPMENTLLKIFGQWSGNLIVK